jgi:hypothetical protein
VVKQALPDDLWSEANELLRLHGRDAAIVAAQEADASLDETDPVAARRWREVVKRINILLERPYRPSN